MTLAGGRATVTQATAPAGHISYLVGPDLAGWRLGVPQYGGVRYREVYPRIDLLFHDASGKLGIVLYAVGAGAMNPPVADGAVSLGFLPLPVPQLPVTVQIRGVQVDPIYAVPRPGTSPGSCRSTCACRTP
jgi:hypothetical protein